MDVQKESTDLKTAIMLKAEALFMRYGLRSVSMDDITRELGISKKTLYQYFESKEDLVLQAIQRHQTCERDTILQLISQAQDPMHELLLIARYFIVQFQHVSPATIYDLKKYYPEAWRLMDELEQKYIYAALQDNLTRGLAAGLYRDNMNTDIMARLYVSMVRTLFEEDLFRQQAFQLGVLYKAFIEFFLRGIASPAGLAKLQLYLQNL